MNQLISTIGASRFRLNLLKFFSVIFYTAVENWLKQTGTPSKFGDCLVETIQVQQGAERDAAIARLEQSRIFLARRLSEHHGKKYKVIEEVLAFVGETSQFVSTNYNSDLCRNKSVTNRAISFNLIKVIVDSFGFAKKYFNVKEMGGVLGDAALVALSMLALLHLHQMGCEDKYMFGIPLKQENAFYNRKARGSYLPEESSSSDHLAHLDVTLARG